MWKVLGFLIYYEFIVEITEPSNILILERKLDYLNITF